MLEEFLKELTELSNKYRVSIWGCGCCGSPNVSPLEEDEMVTEYTITIVDRADYAPLIPKEYKYLYPRIRKGKLIACQ